MVGDGACPVSTTGIRDVNAEKKSKGKEANDGNTIGQSKEFADHGEGCKTDINKCRTY